jgi:DNA-binding transcriptional ArsR family regulator
MTDEASSSATGLFPLRRQVPARTGRPDRVLEIDDDAATPVFDALGSSTARALFAALHEEPRPASDLAELTDTSVQNVQYHLDKFEAAGLIEPAGTWYSSRGMEMTVYAPTDESLVLCSGEGRSERGLSTQLTRILGAVGGLAVLSVAVDLLLRTLISTPASGPSSHGGGEAVEPAVLELAGVAIPPAAIVFLGGLLVLAAVALQHWSGGSGTRVDPPE